MKPLSTNRATRRMSNRRSKHHNAKSAWNQIIVMEGSHKVIRHLPKKSSGIYTPKQATE